MPITIDLETMTFKEKMLLVGEIMRSCEEDKLDLDGRKKAMLEKSIKEKEAGARMIPLEDVNRQIRARYKKKS